MAVRLRSTDETYVDTIVKHILTINLLFYLGLPTVLVCSTTYPIRAAHQSTCAPLKSAYLGKLIVLIRRP